MTDLTKHGLRPRMTLYGTALYAADQVAALVERIERLEGAAHMAMLELGSHGACPACFNAHSTLRKALTKPEGLK